MAGFRICASLVLALAAGCASEGDKPMPDPAPDRPKVNLRFVYVMCNDVAAMKSFYGDQLGLKVAGFANDPKFGYLALKCDGVELLFFRADAAQPVAQAFASQPGWAGGKLETTSWSIQVPEADFAATVGRLRGSGARRFADAPLWAQDSYWAFPVLDPMGNTVEVYSAPKEKPAKKEWPGR